MYIHKLDKCIPIIKVTRLKKRLRLLWQQQRKGDAFTEDCVKSIVHDLILRAFLDSP